MGNMAFPYEDPVDPESAKMDAGKLAAVVDRFQKQQENGSFPGGQLAVRRKGKPVLNLAIGVARGYRSGEDNSPLPVSPQTPFPVLSAGKPLAAIAIAMLEERGALDVEAPIAEIFPEFGRQGKERITTLDVLTHRSGLLMPDFVQRMDLWGDRAAVQKALIEAIPSYPRGTLAYAPYEYGWILSEIVWRVDGRSLADFFAEEIAHPLKLPALRFGLAGRDIDSLAFTYWLGKDKVVVGGVNVAESFEEQNTKQFFDSQNPATTMVCDGASLAAFYDFLIGGGQTASGGRLLSERTIRSYTSRQLLAWDRSLKTLVAIGRGFAVGRLFPSSFGWWKTGQCFGHAGGFSCLTFGDHGLGLSVAIITNGNRSLGDFARRFIPLAHGLRQACEALI